MTPAVLEKIGDQKINSQFLELVPDGFFKRYLDLMVEMNNEMPLPFHFLCMATVLGNALGFRCWAKLARGVEVYPNVNAIILSPAGQCRRGEGSKLAIKIARLAGLNVHEGKFTAEGMADALAQHESMIAYVEELSVLIGKREHQRAVIPFITKACLNSGGPLDERTRGGGLIEIPRANFSCLFTTAPDWFLDTIPEEAYGGGMMSRFIICYLPDREVIYTDPNAEGNDKQSFMELARHLSDMKCNSIQGHIKLQEDANEWFKAWYMKNETKEVDDDRLKPHRNRAPANVLRMAILLTVSNGERTISIKRLKQSIALLDWFAPTVWAMYGYTDLQGSNSAKAEKRVIYLLKTYGSSPNCKEIEIEHSDLIRRGWKAFGEDSGKAKRCLLGMWERGMIEPGWKEKWKGTKRDKAYPPWKWELRAHEEIA